MDSYDKKKIKKMNDAGLLFNSCALAIISLAVFICTFVIAFCTDVSMEIATVLAGVGIFQLAVCGTIAAELEYLAGYYKCKKCGHVHFPESSGNVIFAPHIGWSRYIRCPNCNKKSWHKKVLTKEDDE